MWRPRPGLWGRCGGSHGGWCQAVLRARRVCVVADREHEVRVPRLDQRGNGRLVARAAAEVTHDGEGEPRGSRRRGAKRAGGESPRFSFHRVLVALAGPEAGQPGHVDDAGAGVDPGSVSEEHGVVISCRGTERDDRGAPSHAFGHRPAGQRDGRNRLGDHRDASTERSATSANLRARPVTNHSLHSR